MATADEPARMPENDGSVALHREMLEIGELFSNSKKRSSSTRSAYTKWSVASMIRR